MGMTKRPVTVVSFADEDEEGDEGADVAIHLKKSKLSRNFKKMRQAPGVIEFMLADHDSRGDPRDPSGSEATVPGELSETALGTSSSSSSSSSYGGAYSKEALDALRKEQLFAIANNAQTDPDIDIDVDVDVGIGNSPAPHTSGAEIILEGDAAELMEEELEAAVAIDTNASTSTSIGKTSNTFTDNGTGKAVDFMLFGGKTKDRDGVVGLSKKTNSNGNTLNEFDDDGGGDDRVYTSSLVSSGNVTVKGSSNKYRDTLGPQKKYRGYTSLEASATASTTVGVNDVDDDAEGLRQWEADLVRRGQNNSNSSINNNSNRDTGGNMRPMVPNHITNSNNTTGLADVKRALMEARSALVSRQEAQERLSTQAQHSAARLHTELTELQGSLQCEIDAGNALRTARLYLAELVGMLREKSGMVAQLRTAAEELWGGVGRLRAEHWVGHQEAMLFAAEQAGDLVTFDDQFPLSSEGSRKLISRVDPSMSSNSEASVDEFGRSVDGYSLSSQLARTSWSAVNLARRGKLGHIARSRRQSVQAFVTGHINDNSNSVSSSNQLLLRLQELWQTLDDGGAFGDESEIVWFELFGTDTIADPLDLFGNADEDDNDSDSDGNDHKTENERGDKGAQLKAKFETLSAAAALVCSDARSELRSVVEVLARLETFRSALPDLYRQAFVSLSTPAVLEPMVTLEIVVDRQAMLGGRKWLAQAAWFRAVRDFSLGDVSRSDDLEADCTLLPRVVSSTVTPWLTRLVSLGNLDAYSTPQCQRMSGMVAQLMELCPPSASALSALAAAVAESFGRSLRELCLPSLRFSGERECDPSSTRWFQRQLLLLIKLLGNLVCFKEVLSPKRLLAVSWCGVFSKLRTVLPQSLQADRWCDLQTKLLCVEVIEAACLVCTEASEALSLSNEKWNRRVFDDFVALLMRQREALEALRRDAQSIASDEKQELFSQWATAIVGLSDRDLLI